jgi:type IV pilus assembly protein PilB
LVSRLKNLAKLDQKVSKVPQKGRIDFPLPDQRLRLSFSTMPTILGEKAILKRIGQTRLKKVAGLRKIFLSRKNYDLATAVLKAPYGVFLLAGPAGADKNGLLYSVLDHVNRPEINVAAVEKSVRRRLQGVNQVRVNEEAGFDATSAVQWSLFQDVDVLALDTIKGKEEALVLMDAARTGRLAIAGIDACDSFAALARFFDAGTGPQECLPFLLGIFAQRLARKLCDHCKEKYEAPPEKIDVYFESASAAPVSLYRPRGCDRCGQSGFSGTVALHEVLVFDDSLRKTFSSEGNLIRLKESAEKAGFRNMRYDGLKKALRGLTTIEEVERATLA